MLALVLWASGCLPVRCAALCAHREQHDTLGVVNFGSGSKRVNAVTSAVTTAAGKVMAVAITALVVACVALIVALAKR
jgi:hypothetical protein